MGLWINDDSKWSNHTLRGKELVHFTPLIRDVRGKAYAEKSGGITSNLCKLIYSLEIFV